MNNVITGANYMQWAFNHINRGFWNNANDNNKLKDARFTCEFLRQLDKLESE